MGKAGNASGVLRTAGSALVCALLLGCTGAEAEEPVRRAAEFRSDIVEEQLDTNSDLIRARGFADQAETAWRGFLVDGGAAVDQARFRSGNCYVVLAAASEGIEALRVGVYDSDGTEVARSEEQRRALRYCPPQTGTYFVAVRVNGSGLFAVRRFEGPTGLDIVLDDLGGSDEPE